MASGASATQLDASLPPAKDRIRTGPVPDWVLPCPCVEDFRAALAGPVTHLLHNCQVHAELRQTHHHTAIRLETMEGALGHSPWRLRLEPSQEQIIFHFLRVRRGAQVFNHSDLSAGRFVDHHAAGASSRGHATLELMLEDVRPGDILEWACTVTERPRLLPEYCTAMFTLPANAAVGKFHFAVRFHPSRRMEWKSFQPDWPPAETRNEEEVYWDWTRENFPGLPAEDHAPFWHIPYPWIQISDCPDWGIVSAAYGDAWAPHEDDASVREIAAGLARPDDGPAQAAERAVKLVRGEFRCLAADWELDGHPPAAPGTVARKRYGDGLDLSFFLAHLLNHLGAAARLILVNTCFGRSLGDMLPAPDLFDHALVEYTADGQARWVDVSSKSAGAARRYGTGLPVGGAAARLARPPAAEAQADIYELNESILIDTTGAPSLLAVVVSARGVEAEALSAELAEDREAMGDRRLRHYTGRFSNASRVGEMNCRDDRATGEFHLAEIYEIKGFYTIDPKTKWYKMEMANDFIAELLRPPATEGRRAPLAIRHPGNIRHTIELHSVSLPMSVVKQRDVETHCLRFSRARETMAGHWTMKLSLTTLADAVPAADLEKHLEALEEIRAHSRWALLVPPGEPRPRQRGDFGALPTNGVRPEPAPEPERPAATAPEPAPTPEPEVILQTEEIKGTEMIPPVAPSLDAETLSVNTNISAAIQRTEETKEAESTVTPAPPPKEEIAAAKNDIPPAPLMEPPVKSHEVATAPNASPAKTAAAPQAQTAFAKPPSAKPVPTPVKSKSTSARWSFPKRLREGAPARSVPAVTTQVAGTKRRRRSNSRRRSERMKRHLIMQGCIFALVVILVMALAAKFAGHWNLFSHTPPPTPTPMDSTQ